MHHDSVRCGCERIAAFAGDVPNLNSPGMISAGRQLFQGKQCAYCHGPARNGAIKLAGLSDLEPIYIFETIADGRVKGALRMPSWRGVLTDEQIWQATAYIRSLSSH
jgi:mono/diheme cytochrome c family protein